MDFKKCCSCLFWGGIIIYLHLKLHGEDIKEVINDVKPKIEKTIDKLKK